MTDATVIATRLVNQLVAVLQVHCDTFDDQQAVASEIIRMLTLLVCADREEVLNNPAAARELAEAMCGKRPS